MNFYLDLWEKYMKIIEEAMNENIVRFIKMKIIYTFLISMPVANNLWEIWSVPPVVGDILFFILYTNTVKKSRTGIVKKRNTGAKEL